MNIGEEDEEEYVVTPSVPAPAVPVPAEAPVEEPVKEPVPV
jgi:hypothetical protein